ncbi:MAG: NAD-dependent epimerase/dehydratase family protein, partial [Methyloligellaceae bacterium]
MTKSILITGASGFLGAWIMQRLSKEDVDVIACDLRPDETRLQMVTEGHAPANVTWEQLDVSDTDKAVALAKRYEPAAIIHLAALLIPDCRDNPPAAVRINVLGDANMFEAARQVGNTSVVFTSSAAARPRGPKNRVANLYGAFKAV